MSAHVPSRVSGGPGSVGPLKKKIVPGQHSTGSSNSLVGVGAASGEDPGRSGGGVGSQRPQTESDATVLGPVVTPGSGLRVGRRLPWGASPTGPRKVGRGGGASGTGGAGAGGATVGSGSGSGPRAVSRGMTRGPGESQRPREVD